MSDIEETNQLIDSMGIKFRAEIVRPVGPSPSRFPVNQSFSLAATYAFFTFPAFVRKILKRTTPEDIAQQGKRLGTRVSPLPIWMFGYHFLLGREILLDWGQFRPSAHANDIAQTLNFWRRLAFTQRGDGHLDNSEAGFTNQFLPSSVVQRLYHALIPVDTEIRRQVTRFLSALETYLFLLNAEAHLSIADSGPYLLNAERVLIIRDFFDLTGQWYPWHDVTLAIPYQACSLAFTLDPRDFHSVELSDRAALLTSPSQYADAICEIALISNDAWGPQVLPFTEMDRLTRAVKKTQPPLSRWFARLSRRDWIIAGALPWIFRPLAVLTHPHDLFSWDLAPTALELLPTYEEDDARAVRWATHRCLAPGRATAFSLLSDDEPVGRA